MKRDIGTAVEASWTIELSISTAVTVNNQLLFTHHLPAVNQYGNNPTPFITLIKPSLNIIPDTRISHPQSWCTGLHTSCRSNAVSSSSGRFWSWVWPGHPGMKHTNKVPWTHSVLDHSPTLSASLNLTNWFHCFLCCWLFTHLMSIFLFDENLLLLSKWLEFLEIITCAPDRRANSQD